MCLHFIRLCETPHSLSDCLLDCTNRYYLNGSFFTPFANVNPKSISSNPCNFNIWFLHSTYCVQLTLVLLESRILQLLLPFFVGIPGSRMFRRVKLMSATRGHYDVRITLRTKDYSSANSASRCPRREQNNNLVCQYIKSTFLIHFSFFI